MLALILRTGDLMQRTHLSFSSGGSERSLFIDEAAQVLGLSRRTVYYRIRDGRLRTIRTRGGSQRVLVSSIEALRCEVGRAVTGYAAGDAG